jgi:hypothetical protein
MYCCFSFFSSYADQSQRLGVKGFVVFSLLKAPDIAWDLEVVAPLGEIVIQV